jgi:hypothetical protein
LTGHRDGNLEGISRRGFVKTAATVAAFTIVPRQVLGGAGSSTPPSSKINVAIIGTGGQGTVNMKQLFNEPDVRIAALCDINEESDYSAWYYGGTAGLKPATELVRQKYGQACPTYHDYHEMLDNGILFVGTKGSILGEGWGRSPCLIPEAKMQAYRRPPSQLA